MILNALIGEGGIENKNKRIYNFEPLNEADDFGDGTGPNNDNEDENYEINDDDQTDNQNTDGNEAAAQNDNTEDDNYEIQDDDIEQPNVENPDDNDQTDNQNTGDEENDDYEIQDDDDNQEAEDNQDDNQNTGDDQGDDGDDYEIQDDEDNAGDGDNGGADDGEANSSNGGDSTDTGTSNAGISGDGNDPRAKLNALEKSIFDQLSPDQQKAKTSELKGLFQLAFDNCQKIIDTISSTESNPNTVKVLDYIVSRLTDLKGYITDYLKDVFDTKGYLENMTEFQKYLAIFDTIKNTFDDIQKEQE